MVPALRRLRAVPLLLVAAACASSSFEAGVYRGSNVSFRLPPVPPTWRRVEVPGSDLAFRDEAHEASILVNSRCSTRDSDAPLVALSGHLIMGTTDRHVAREEIVPFDGREAIHTVLSARLDGVSMTYDIYVLKKDGCVFDLVYVTPTSGAGKTTSIGNVPGEWGQFATGFHTIPAPS